MALSKECVEQWREKFTKKLKRTTSRNALDRLLLSVDRVDFDNLEGAGWTKVKFENGRGLVAFKNGQTEFEVTPLQKNLLSDKNVIEEFKDKWIPKSKLEEETEKWKDYNSKSMIYEGGEAIVFKEYIENVKVAVRVQAFDSALYTPECSDDQLFYDVHLPSGKMREKIIINTLLRF